MQVKPAYRLPSRPRRVQPPAHCSAAATVAPPATSSQRLITWLAESGASVKGVAIGDTRLPDGTMIRGVVATRDIEAGEELIRVPPSCQVSYKHATDNNLVQLMERVPAGSATGKGAWQFKMALYLLAELLKGPAGERHAYLQTLPGQAPDSPLPTIAMLFTEQELKELQDPLLYRDAVGQAYWARKFAKDVLKKLPRSKHDPFAGQQIKEEHLGWGLAMAMSRSYGFKQVQGHVMVPLIDMANHHSTEYNCEVACDDLCHATLTSVQPVKVGEPVLVRYGAYDNRDLLLSYGFVVADNPANSFVFQFELDPVLSAIMQFAGSSEVRRPGRILAPWQQQKLAELQLTGEHSNPTVAFGGRSTPVGPRLLAAIRVMLCDDRELIEDCSLQELGDWDEPLELEHELVVLKALCGLSAVLYKAMPTTIQQDKRLLTEPATGQRRQQLRIALEYRLERKRTLEAATKLVLTRLLELQQSLKQGNE